MVRFASSAAGSTGWGELLALVAVLAMLPFVFRWGARMLTLLFPPVIAQVTRSHHTGSDGVEQPFAEPADPALDQHLHDHHFEAWHMLDHANTPSEAARRAHAAAHGRGEWTRRCSTAEPRLSVRTVPKPRARARPDDRP